jgi:hypothetical protein
MSEWASARARQRRSMRATSFLCWTLLGITLMQAAWILVVPPFRGLDEFDHAFKAAAVAGGDWSYAHRPSTRGWGEFVEAPTSLIEAASPVCESYPYTSSDNCRPSGVPHAGVSEVASSAARYNPSYYAVVGPVGSFFQGNAALYAMRAMSALLCALLVAWSLVVARSWARSAWPTATILLAATPVVMFSTTVVAPNGVELCAALLLWVSLLGMARASGDPRDSMRLLVPATVAAIPLVTVRTLGPLWLVLIVLTCASLLTRSDRRWMVRRTRVRVAAAIIAGFAGLAVVWSLLARTNAVPGSDAELGSAWAVAPAQTVLWVLQSIAAFPTRTDSAPGLVYVAVAIPWLIVSALAWRVAERRYRFALLGVVAVSLLVPLTFLLVTYSAAGSLWQGRYSYPYAMGFVLICGWVADRSPRTSTWSANAQRWCVVAVGATSALALSVGQVGVLTHESAHSPLAASGAWTAPPAWLIVALTASGWGILTWVLTNRATGLAPTPAQSHEPRRMTSPHSRVGASDPDHVVAP